jgi:hypothetical protein
MVGVRVTAGPGDGFRSRELSVKTDGIVFTELGAWVVGRHVRLQTKLTCNGVRVEVNRVHYWKLRALFERHNRPDPTERRAPKGKGKGKSEFRRRFDEAAFCLLARYSSLQGTHYRGGGFQVSHPLSPQQSCPQYNARVHTRTTGFERRLGEVRRAREGGGASDTTPGGG